MTIDTWVGPRRTGIDGDASAIEPATGICAAFEENIGDSLETSA